MTYQIKHLSRQEQIIIANLFNPRKKELSLEHAHQLITSIEKSVDIINTQILNKPYSQWFFDLLQCSFLQKNIEYVDITSGEKKIFLDNNYSLAGNYLTLCRALLEHYPVHYSEMTPGSVQIQPPVVYGSARNQYLPLPPYVSAASIVFSPIFTQASSHNFSLKRAYLIFMAQLSSCFSFPDEVANLSFNQTLMNLNFTRYGIYKDMEIYSILQIFKANSISPDSIALSYSASDIAEIRELFPRTAELLNYIQPKILNPDLVQERQQLQENIKRLSSTSIDAPTEKFKI